MAGDTFLLCRAGSRLCALPLEHVIETMRPLHTDVLMGTPNFVSGVAVVRGAPVPVVDVSRLLAGIDAPSSPTRFVSIRVGARRAALAFDAVLGVRTFDSSLDQPTPPLLQDAGAGAIAAVRALDAELLCVLESVRAVPSAVWTALEQS